MVVGGRPGVGKTVAALQWARCMAMAGCMVVYASYGDEERTLLARLLGLEMSASVDGEDDRTVARVRRELSLLSAGHRSVEEAVGPPGGLLQRTTARFRSYGDRLFLLSSADPVGMSGLRRLLDARTVDDAAVFVDHLQGIPRTADLAGSAPERTAAVATALKQTALSDGVAVVAVSGTTGEGLAASRVRLHHLDGADTFVDDCDIVVVLNDKATAVTRVHRARHPFRARRYGEYVIVTVEKNRRGGAAVDLDFRKDFTHCRFEPDGAFTAERLTG